MSLQSRVTIGVLSRAGRELSRRLAKAVALFVNSSNTEVKLGGFWLQAKSYTPAITPLI